MRTIPNTFIANMSLSDLLMAVLNCSFNYVTMRDRKWDFGQAYCTINNFMAIVTVTASVLNLTAMSLDRWEWRNFVTFSKVMRHLLGLLMAVLNCSVNYVTMRDRKWVFGQAYCTINNFMAIVTVTASVLNLTAMSLDRWEWRNFVTFSKVMRHLLGHKPFLFNLQ